MNTTEPRCPLCVLHDELLPHPHMTDEYIGLERTACELFSRRGSPAFVWTIETKTRIFNSSHIYFRIFYGRRHLRYPRRASSERWLHIGDCTTTTWCVFYRRSSRAVPCLIYPMVMSTLYTNKCFLHRMRNTQYLFVSKSLAFFRKKRKNRLLFHTLQTAVIDPWFSRYVFPSRIVHTT